MVEFLTLDERNSILLAAYRNLTAAFEWPDKNTPGFLHRTIEARREADRRRSALVKQKAAVSRTLIQS
jgi:hypothetical protein